MRHTAHAINPGSFPEHGSTFKKAGGRKGNLCLRGAATQIYEQPQFRKFWWTFGFPHSTVGTCRNQYEWKGAVPTKCPWLKWWRIDEPFECGGTLCSDPTATTSEPLFSTHWSGKIDGTKYNIQELSWTLWNSLSYQIINWCTSICIKIITWGKWRDLGRNFLNALPCHCLYVYVYVHVYM